MNGANRKTALLGEMAALADLMGGGCAAFKRLSEPARAELRALFDSLVAEFQATCAESDS
jgi:hypothetical protein